MPPDIKTRTITLTDRAPVRIKEDDWPLVAEYSLTDNDRIPDQSNTDWSLRYRRHKDGRGIVYGVCNSNDERKLSCRAGELLAPGAEIGIAAALVSDAIGFEGVQLVRGFLAALPAELLE